MHSRTLPKDAVLWWQNSPAESVGVLERGKIGIRSEGRILAVALPVTAVGEVPGVTVQRIATSMQRR